MTTTDDRPKGTLVLTQKTNFFGRRRWRWTFKTEGEPLAVSVRSFLTEHDCRMAAHTVLDGIGAPELSFSRSRFRLRAQRWRWFLFGADGTYLAKSSEGYANEAYCRQIGYAVTSGGYQYDTIVDLRA